MQRPPVSLVLGACAAVAAAAACSTRPSAVLARGDGLGEVAFEASTADLLEARLPVAESAESAASAAVDGPCPRGMVKVEGAYCPEVAHRCLEWLDPPTSRYAHFRCARYDRAPRCTKTRVAMRFCIDRTERTEDDGRTPRNAVSFRSATQLCEAAGARVCTESEWQFACEGEEMRPYPYGFERDPTACNTDRTVGLGRVGHLVDHRQAAAANPRCASPFGVLDLAGNVEEWVRADGHKLGWRQVLKGSWWIASRHACRSFQVGHDAAYAGTETGTRCCSALRSGDAAARALVTPSAAP